MSWLDSYRQASFRNVPFYVSGQGTEGGRRAVVHEFPQGELHAVQDLGARAKVFNLDAYIIGDDYFPDRDALIDALDTPGLGTLVHPYYGKIRVQITSYSLSERKQQGRIARFTINAVEASGIDITTAVKNTQEQILTARESVMSALQLYFLFAYSIANEPYSVLNNIEDTVGDAFTAMQSARTLVNRQAEFADRVDENIANANRLFKDVNVLFEETIWALSFGALPTDKTFEATVDNSKQQFNEMKRLFDFSAREDYGPGPAQVYEYLNRAAAVTSAAGLMANMDYDSKNEADEKRDIIFSQIDDIQSDEGTVDEVFSAMDDLRTAIQEDLDQRGANLSSLAELTTTESEPALVISNSLYNSVSPEDDLIKRNIVIHPGFVSGGRPIEVLIDA